MLGSKKVFGVEDFLDCWRHTKKIRLRKKRQIQLLVLSPTLCVDVFKHAL